MTSDELRKYAKKEWRELDPLLRDDPSYSHVTFAAACLEKFTADLRKQMDELRAVLYDAVSEDPTRQIEAGAKIARGQAMRVAQEWGCLPESPCPTCGGPHLMRKEWAEKYGEDACLAGVLKGQGALMPAPDSEVRARVRAVIEYAEARRNDPACFATLAATVQRLKEAIEL